ncbi:Bifunctional DNA primase/polymerase, N-terminal [Streptomyces sp. 2224.1]|uniref:bifunctional DNA primase/polymerase n=1 Tax=Streptomyces sp. 2224.1 TaxID=1881020 RepID=UPI00089C938B|nr:bifunctional DNA primase/polymerase [Streptomyces sp. 2224.1]SEC16357.1 Bifunctional DNA primase/polymerase, N-terminal [Streptomyces sp. 2224.1]
MNEHLLKAALDAAANGWAVIPLRPGDKRPALHGEAACPAIGDCAGGHRKWEQRATTDPDRIRTAWSHGPFNVGIATGPSGLVVVDLDMPKTKNNSNADTPCGVTTFQALCERTGQPLPTTRTVRTASGGVHLYFITPSGARLSNSAGRLGKLIDTRARGGYVVAPGSTTAAGTYTVTDPTAPAVLPDWLYALLAPRQPSRGLTATPATPKASRYAAAALTAETATVESASEGQRNTTLLRAARALGRFIVWGDLPRSVVEEALQSAGESIGLSPSGCRSTIRSGLNWSIAHNSQRRTA